MCFGFRASDFGFSPSVIRFLLPRTHHPAPPGRGQAGGLLESAGEVALMGKAAVAGDLQQLLLAIQQSILGVVNLALQEKLLWRKAHQLSKAPMEMERAEFHLLGNLDKGWPAAVFLLHEFKRGDEPGQLMIRQKSCGLTDPQSPQAGCRHM